MVPVLARGPFSPSYSPKIRLATDNVYGHVDSLNRSVLVYFDVLQLVFSPAGDGVRLHLCVGRMAVTC